MALPFCVRLYKNVCLYYTRYADVDYIKIDFQRKNCLLESAFGLRILSGFVFGIFCFHVWLHSALCVSPRRGVLVTSTLDNIHASWFPVEILTKWGSRGKLEGRERRSNCVWLSRGPHGAIPGCRESWDRACWAIQLCYCREARRSAALQRFTLTHGFLEQWLWKPVKAPIHQCH